MAITLTQWISKKFGVESLKNNKLPIHEDWLETTIGDFYPYGFEFAIRDIAFWQCVNLVANALSRCEFKTFNKGEEVKKDEYYRWNYQPNVNQNTSAFMKKLCAHLFLWNEAVVVVDKKTNQMVVADNWSVDKYAFKENIYRDITLETLEFKRTLKESDVFHFTLHTHGMKPLLNGLYDVYDDIITYAINAYVKSRGEKGVVKLPTNYSNNPQAQQFVASMQKDFGNFAEAESALLPLFGDMEYTSVARPTYSNDTSRDTRSLFDDVLDFTARAFCIPPALLSGQVEGLQEAIDQFLTFCIDPIADMMTEEINRKLYGKKILKGSYVRIDTSTVSHIDLLSVATNVDKLISSGAYTINELRKILGSDVIDDAVGDVHWITKNYANIELVANETVPDNGNTEFSSEQTEQKEEVGEDNGKEETIPDENRK